MKDAVSGNSLPDEGKQAIQQRIQRSDWPLEPTSGWKIVSAKKAPNQTRRDELWCVVIDPILHDVWGLDFSHFEVYREGLLWKADAIEDEPDDQDEEESWLRLGCDNW